MDFKRFYMEPQMLTKKLYLPECTTLEDVLGVLPEQGRPGEVGGVRGVPQLEESLSNTCACASL